MSSSHDIPPLPGLPAPDPDAAALSACLADLVRAEIGAATMTFSRFMARALYEPGLGYYSAGLAKFGAAGDFITAPEVSPLFGRCLARQCRQVLSETGGDLLEVGAGSGALAADILTTLAGLDALPSRYYILEVSAALREQQREMLRARAPDLLGRVEWLESWPAAGFIGVVLANEVLDAMPVERFCIGAETVLAEHVACEQGDFVLRDQPAEAPLADAVMALQARLPQPMAIGHRAEINLALPAWVAGLAGCLSRGAVLCIDYGEPEREFYAAARSQGTLKCHYRHHVHNDPLVLTGLQDITADVDFTALAQAGVDAGLTLAGYTTQAHFLLATGLLEEAPPGDALREQLLHAQQIKRLTLPEEFGERFKVMAFTRDLDISLAGFALRDIRERL